MPRQVGGSLEHCDLVAARAAGQSSFVVAAGAGAEHFKGASDEGLELGLRVLVDHGEEVVIAVFFQILG